MLIGKCHHSTFAEWLSGVASKRHQHLVHLDFCLVSDFCRALFHGRWPNISVSTQKMLEAAIIQERNPHGFSPSPRVFAYQTFLMIKDCRNTAEVKIGQTFNKNPIKVLVEEKYQINGLDEITDPWHLPYLVSFQLVPCHQH